ncbi:MAG: hypothetical protein IT319_14835, partial [Anaerolineae bacterium]|nr:hypothetical protein [Anaerolineae bacterium]
RQARAPRAAHELNALIDAHDNLLHLIDTGDANAACQSLREQLDEYQTAIVAALRV